MVLAAGFVGGGCDDKIVQNDIMEEKVFNIPEKCQEIKSLVRDQVWDKWSLLCIDPSGEEVFYAGRPLSYSDYDKGKYVWEKYILRKNVKEIRNEKLP